MKFTRLLSALWICGALVAQAPHSVTLSWSYDADATFSVYKANGPCEGPPTMEQIATGLTEKTYQDTAVSTGQYCYAATATVAGAESAYSNLALAEVPATGQTRVTRRVIE
jgi:hypothetical protein